MNLTEYAKQRRERTASTAESPSTSVSNPASSSSSSYSYNSPEANATYMSTPNYEKLSQASSAYSNYSSSPASSSNEVSQLGYLQNAINAQQENANQSNQYDTNKIMEVANALKESLGLNQKYTSPYQDEVLNLYGKMKNYYDNPYVYDPNKDEALRVAQNQAMNRVKQDMAASGRLYSSYTDTQMQQAAQGLIPQYQQLADQKNQQQINNLYNQLYLLQNLENSAYSKNRDKINDSLTAFQLADSAYNNNFNRGLAESSLTGMYNGNPTFEKTNSDRTYDLQKDANDLNRTSTMAQLTGQVPASQLIAQMSPEQIEAYQALGNQDGGFAAAINATNDPVQKAIITEFRNRYLQANPDNPYYNTISPNTMANTLQAQQVQSALETEALQRVGMEISNKINQIKLDNLPEATRLELLTAQIQADKGNAELAYQLIVNSNAPEQFKSEIASIYQNIEASKANIAQGWENIAQGWASIENQRASLQQRASSGGSSGGSGSTDLQFKKSPYFERTFEQIQKMVNDMRDDENIAMSIKDASGNVVKEIFDWTKIPGSVQYNQITKRIFGDPSLNDYEKILMLEDFGIPYSEEAVKEVLKQYNQ